MTVDSGEHRRLSAAARIDPALPGLLSAGGVLGALAASACCLLPLVLFGLGVSGAWIGNLTRLAPYQPYFLGAAAACLGGGYWRVWRSRRSRCAEGDACARPLPRRAVMASLVFATILVAAALVLDLIAPWLLAS
jgi:mercuric ion transport protein